MVIPNPPDPKSKAFITAPNGFCPYCGSHEVGVAEPSPSMQVDLNCYSDYIDYECGDCDKTWRNIAGKAVRVTE